MIGPLTGVIQERTVFNMNTPIPGHKRKLGCLWLLNHRFDVEGAIDYVIAECADEPALQNATDKRKLARNIVTIGGTGLQQMANLSAFKEALGEFDEERQRRVVQHHQEDLDAVNTKLHAAEQRANAAERDYRVMAQRALEAPASVVPPVVTPPPETQKAIQNPVTV